MLLLLLLLPGDYYAIYHRFRAKAAVRRHRLFHFQQAMLKGCSIVRTWEQVVFALCIRRSHNRS
jgi:hypothetical protein